MTCTQHGKYVLYVRTLAAWYNRLLYDRQQYLWTICLPSLLSVYIHLHLQSYVNSAYTHVHLIVRTSQHLSSCTCTLPPAFLPRPLHSCLSARPAFTYALLSAFLLYLFRLARYLTGCITHIQNGKYILCIQILAFPYNRLLNSRQQYFCTVCLPSSLSVYIRPHL